MNVLEAIRARRAVRDYQERPVEVETVKALLRAAVQAPSAMNHQPWRFAVVQDTARLKRYSDAAKELLLAQQARDQKIRAYSDVLSSPGFNIFYNAGTLVTICAEKRSPYSEADAWLAAENLMLAACEAGLGTCCIGFAVGVLNTPAVKQELQVPPDGAALAPIIVGYPRAIPAPVPRQEPHILSWLL
jgi:nitroreductase